jgi:ATP/maltotriose-dependent transcriptional regulator MalT
MPDDPPACRARLAMAIGRTAWRSGDPEAAIAPCRHALAIAEALGAAAYEVAIGCRLMLGCILGGRGRIDEAAQILEDARVLAESRGDLLHGAAARCNRFPVHAARGDLRALRADLVAFAAAGR